MGRATGRALAGRTGDPLCPRLTAALRPWSRYREAPRGTACPDLLADFRGRLVQLRKAPASSFTVSVQLFARIAACGVELWSVERAEAEAIYHQAATSSWPCC